MAKKLGRCSRCKNPLTAPGHKQAGAVLCDNCYFGHMKYRPDGTYPDGTRPKGNDELSAFKRTLDPKMRKLADEIWKEK